MALAQTVRRTGTCQKEDEALDLLPPARGPLNQIA
jgi:hypothetical protein